MNCKNQIPGACWLHEVIPDIEEINQIVLMFADKDSLAEFCQTCVSPGFGPWNHKLNTKGNRLFSSHTKRLFGWAW